TFPSSSTTYCFDMRKALPDGSARVTTWSLVPTAMFSIEGHTDSNGNDATNQKLSEDRAAAVKTYLVKNGIANSRLTSAGFGESKPIDSNKTKAGKANNRRVEVKLVK
ncbi:MAG: OmpA family protein, partial [Flavobacteriaceae bacterium]|nr:OmpA family protein [Flavobacteriaceae bacterium]